MENLITRNTKFASVEEVVQFVEEHKGAGIAVFSILALTHVVDKNLRVFLHNLSNTISENGCVLDSKLGKVTIQPKTACN